MTRPNHVRLGKIDRRRLVAGAAGLGLSAPFLGHDMSAFAALARQEGLLVGPSSGANVKVALDVARELGPGHTVVTVLADTGERYVD